MKRYFITALMFALPCSCSLSATAGVLFTETFDGATLPDTLTYSTGGPKNVWRIDGSNRLLDDYDSTQTGATWARAITTQGFLDPVLPITYSLDVGVPEGIGTGSYNVGMQFGDYEFLFHPGYTDIPGAFRVAGGFGVSNQDMGFVPKLGVLHHAEVTTRWIGGDLGVDIMIEGLGTDDLMHTFNYSFIDTTPNLGSGTFGGRRSGDGNDVSDVIFDNFQAEVAPEPSSVVMLMFGAIGLAFGRRRRRQAQVML